MHVCNGVQCQSVLDPAFSRVPGKEIMSLVSSPALLATPFPLDPESKHLHSPPYFTQHSDCLSLCETFSESLEQL